ncbi:MAG: ATP-binding cassette domain-containing protein [Flavobacterium sp.]|nr:MAG: ATP-binding cassette domain-containing protein [Flavobacterium sp.]
MSKIILKAVDISKQYRLGLVGTGTITHDLNRFWHRIRGKEDPYLKVGAVNDRSIRATEDYVWALRDINFEVEQGEVLGIIGKNGAGKSTLLKILSRVTSPTTGVIKTKGRIASLLEVGTGFHPELTGRENIYLNGAILGMTRSEIKAKEEEIIDFSGCELYIDTPVKRYSSGMRVRLGFAVAAHLEPDILVVDEVLAVGDAEFQKKAIGKMQDISQGDGRTVLFVSHNMDSVKNLCSRAIVLDNGLISFSGNQNDAVSFYTKTQQQKVRDFIEFENRGNEFAEVNSIGLNKGSSQILMTDDLKIEIEFTLLRNSTKRIDISIAILNDSEILVTNLGTGHLETSPVKNIINKKQKIVFTAHSPNLNTGIYSIVLRVVENMASRAQLRIDDIINFEVSTRNDSDIYLRTKGVIQPKLTITTIQ